MLLACRREGLECTLNDSLRTDVNPRAGGHLPVHDEAKLLQLIELLPVRPVAHQVRVADEYAWRVLVRLKDADRLARLHQQRLIVFQSLQRVDDGVVALPIACGAAGSAIHHEVLRTLGDVGIEIVHQHAHGGFLPPAFAGELVAARRFNRNIGKTGYIGCDWHDSKMVAVASGQWPVASSQLSVPVSWLLATVLKGVCENCAVPTGLSLSSFPLDPALKRWAKLFRPLRGWLLCDSLRGRKAIRGSDTTVRELSPRGRRNSPTIHALLIVL